MIILINLIYDYLLIHMIVAIIEEGLGLSYFLTFWCLTMYGILATDYMCKPLNSHTKNIFIFISPLHISLI